MDEVVARSRIHQMTKTLFGYLFFLYHLQVFLWSIEIQDSHTQKLEEKLLNKKIPKIPLYLIFWFILTVNTNAHYLQGRLYLYLCLNIIIQWTCWWGCLLVLERIFPWKSWWNNFYEHVIKLSNINIGTIL